MRLSLALCCLLAAVAAQAEDSAEAAAYARLRDTADETRASACRDLAKPPLRGVRARATLVEMLDDPSYAVRLTAAKSLITYDDITVLNPVERMLRSEPSGSFRRELAVALAAEPAHRENPEATRILVALLGEDPEAEVRRAVATAMAGRTGDSTVIGVERKAAAFDPDKTVRAAAAAALKVVDRPVPKPKPKPVVEPNEHGVKGTDPCPKPWGWCECTGLVKTKSVCVKQSDCRHRFHDFYDNPAMACRWDGQDLSGVSGN